MLDGVTADLPPNLGDDPTDLMNQALDIDRAGHADAARALYREIGRRLPHWDEAPLRLAESFRRAGLPHLAMASYAEALELNPRRCEALLGLGALALVGGDVARAQGLFLRCCGIAPDLAEAWDALGSALLLTGDVRAAESAYAEATRLMPDDIAMGLRRSDAARLADGTTPERERLEAALAHDPANPALLTPLAVLLEREGRRAEAIDYLALAVALCPEAPAPQSLLAQYLVHANRMREALAALDRAIELAPDDLSLRNNRAATLIRLHRFAGARDALLALVAEHGDKAGVLNNLSNALVSLGLQDEGAAIAVRAVAAEPGSDLAWRTLCNALPYCEGIGGRELLSATRRASAAMTRYPAAPPPTDLDPTRKLRIGLLSPALKTHPVGWLTVAGFENLDPAAFEIHCLGSEYGTDPIYRRFRLLAKSWTGFDGLNQAEVVARCQSLDLDIVIDLGGNGDQGMLGLCASRLAPVQMKWVGSQNHSTGLAEMDWFITDRWETPEGFDTFYSERLCRLPDGYVCYSPPPYAPDVAPLPALVRGAITFGCFNNMAKITAGTIAAWAGILRAVPGSRLAVMCHQMADAGTRDHLAARFTAHGVGAEQLTMWGGAPHRDLLARYGDIDIVLDPFPYTGGLTTCEALWMGVPVVTMPGEIFASRHSASHLTNIGLPDWVAADPDDYHRIAVTRAADLAALAAMRAGLRARMRTSPLCDGPRFGRNLGAALRMAWQDLCRR